MGRSRLVPPVRRRRDTQALSAHTRAAQAILIRTTHDWSLSCARSGGGPDKKPTAVDDGRGFARDVSG